MRAARGGQMERMFLKTDTDDEAERRYHGKKEKTGKLPEGWELRDNFQPVFLNKYGYYELRKKNTREERDRNFEENYFQEYAGATYQKAYPQEELEFILNKIEERAWVVEENLRKVGNQHMTEASASGEAVRPMDPGSYSLLDIGCGEGFLLQYFYEKGVRVKGIDCGSYALQSFHPQMLAYFEQGDMETLLPQMAERGETYDVINMDRVLDMVLNPEECLAAAEKLMTDQSILVVKVANNYSHLQQMLLASGELKEEYWLDDPDHTGYFNREGMLRLLEACGFEQIDFYGDTFVDFQLLNPNSNYYERPETGKAAHATAVRLENLFHVLSMEKTVELYRILGDMGFGREIVGVFRKKSGRRNNG